MCLGVADASAFNAHAASVRGDTDSPTTAIVT